MAELRLDVTLNLAGFRAQLDKLATEASTRLFGVKLSIDTVDFEKQLTNLEKIKPVITINDSQLDAAKRRIGTLNKSLATLRRATSTPIEIKVKYVEVGKPPSDGTAQIGRAVSGGVRGSQAIEGLSRSQLQSARKAMVGAGMSVGEMGNLAKASTDEYKKSIIQGFTNSGQEAINGFAAGLKDSSSKIGQAAAKVGEEGIRGIKDALGIASPSKVFRQIGEFSVDGLELGFLNGLKDFKSKSISEVRTIVALLKLEFAKIKDISGAGVGPTTGRLRQQLVGNRMYSAPIGPLPVGSEAPYARGDRGQFGYSGYEPRMVSRLRGTPPIADPNSFLQFSRNAAQVQPLPVTQGGFRGFSQRATQVQQAAGGGAVGGMPVGGGGAGGGGFPSDGRMPIGKQGPATFIGAGSQMEKFKTALDVSAASSRNFSASQLPLIGGLKGIAGELGQATKQVLLYGAAYKGLSFIISLPGQLLNAAKSQQQFTNALKVSTQETGTFAKEMLFVDNVQRAFGLNLETTRTGFVRLFASMAPTGFDSGSIEKLFTGISAATAALQLTPDKAERVIYAFGQMASKGQIMAEELKGQLGDVLPGALAIFAKAAGMSVKDFSKAMEDGEFTGNRFREVFAKVSDELINRFGTGAQIAGKSLQGLINTVGGDFTRTLESFAPLADSAAQATLGPLSRMLRDVGIAAQIAMGEVGRVQAQIKDAKQIVVDLKVGGAKPEQIKAAEKNVLALEMRYKQLNTTLQDPAMVQRVNDIRNFTTELAKAGTFVMNLAGVIGNVLSPFLTILGGNFTSIIGNLTLFALGFTAIRLAALLFTGTLATVNTVVAANGTISMAAAVKSTLLAGAFRVVGVQATGAQIATMGFGTAVKGLIASTGIGLLVVLVGSLATAFLSMRDRAKEAGEASRDAIKEGAHAAAMGQVLPVTAQLNQELAKNRVVSEGLKTLERIHDTNKAIMRGGGRPIISTSDMASLKGAAEYSNEIAGIISGNQLKKGGKGFEIQAFLMPQLSQAREQAGQISAETRKSSILLKEQQQQALRNAKRLGLNDPTLGTGTNEGETEEEKRKREQEKKLEDTRANRQSQLDQEAANRQIALDQSSFDSRLRMSDAEYDHKRALQDDYFAREISGLDSIEARQKKHQQDLKAIEDRRIDSIRKAELDAVKAVQDLRSATVKAGKPVSGGLGSVNPAKGSKFQGFEVTGLPGESRAYRNGTHEGFDFATPIGTALSYSIGGIVKSIDKVGRGKAGKTIEVMLNNGITGMSMHLSEVLLAAGQSFEANQIIAKTGDTGAGPAHLHQESAPHGYRSGQAGASLAYLNVGSGGPRPKSRSVDTNTRPGEYAMGRREDKAEGNLAVEQQDAQNRALEKSIILRNENDLALQRTITSVKQNIDSIFPVKEQKLENDLLELRNNLESKGASKQMIDMEVAKAKAIKESALAMKTYTDKITENETSLKEYNKIKTPTEKEKEQIKFLTDQIAVYKAILAGLPKLQAEFNNELARTAKLTTETSFKSAITSLKDRMKMAQAFTSDQELKTQISLDYRDSSPEKQQEIYDLTKVARNLEDTKALIGNFVSSTLSDYKGFLKAVISGEDAVDALQKFQEGLTDKVLTIFLDFAMAPVEEVMKKSLGGLFARKADIPKVNEAEVPVVANTTATDANTEAIKANTSALGGKVSGKEVDPMSLEDFSKGVPIKTEPFVSSESAFADFNTKDMFTGLNTEGMFSGLNEQIRAGLAEIPSSLDEATANLQISSEPFQQALIVDLPNTITAAGKDVKTQGATFGEGLTSFVGGIGAAAAGIAGIAAGISQIGKGGTSNVLGGIGSILMGAGGAIGGFGKIFGFADGGMVSGPTLGMVGEGKYNEAIVPLPNGRSIPVQFNQESSLRSAMGNNNSNNNSVSPVLSMSFETTRFGNTDYVSREQLEAAMMQTRAEATKAGARRGMTMTLDKLQQSPSTRSRVGLG